MPDKVYIVGVGPGSPEYLLPIAKKIIEQAEILVGGHRLLKQYAGSNQEQVIVNADLAAAEDYIKQNFSFKQIAVLVSGDPGLYSLLPRVKAAVGDDNIEVIPGISSVQLAFARIKKGFEDALIISLHGRRPDNLVDMIRLHPKVALLTDPEFTPPQIAAFLLAAGIANRRVWTAQNLSYEDEIIIDTDLINLAQMSGFDNVLLIIGSEI